MYSVLSWHAQYSDMATWIALSSGLYAIFAKLTFLYRKLTFKGKNAAGINCYCAVGIITLEYVYLLIASHSPK